MPVYNAEKYLRECIDSILTQTFTDFELLIVDDGSTDHSSKIIESYSDVYNRTPISFIKSYLGEYPHSPIIEMDSF